MAENCVFLLSSCNSSTSMTCLGLRNVNQPQIGPTNASRIFRPRSRSNQRLASELLKMATRSVLRAACSILIREIPPFHSTLFNINQSSGISRVLLSNVAKFSTSSTTRSKLRREGNYLLATSILFFCYLLKIKLCSVAVEGAFCIFVFFTI